MPAQRAVTIGQLMDFYVRSFLLIGFGMVLVIILLQNASSGSTSSLASYAQLLSALKNIVVGFGIVLIAIGVIYVLVLTYFTLRIEDVKPKMKQLTLDQTGDSPRSESKIRD